MKRPMLFSYLIDLSHCFTTDSVLLLRRYRNKITFFLEVIFFKFRSILNALKINKMKVMILNVV
jgi:hypothetical protein